MKVKFDCILGRLREKDGDGGDTPTPPVTHTFTATTTGSNKTYYADQQETDTLTVTVALRYDGELVDADTVPSGWEKVANTTGQYTKTISGSGSTGAATFSYTANGETKTANAQSKTLTKVYPAYWGIYPDNDTSPTDITAIVADLYSQNNHLTSNLANTINVPNNTESTCWLWIVTKATATAYPAATPGLSMLDEPVADKSFTSPLSNAINLQGYKVYVSKNSAKAGAGFGSINLTINISHTP